VPLPFSTMVFSFGKPTFVPKGLAREDYESLRLEIEHNMILGQEQAECKVREIKLGVSSPAAEPMPASPPTTPLP
jgi:hypothetical protein